MKKKIAIIGLGVLGSNLARLLSERGAEILAIDSDMNRVEEIKDRVTIAVCLNATNERALAAQGLAEVDAAVVCIGEHFEANVLATVLLKKIGVKRVITRASSSVQREILKEVGADELIFPEEDLARELAIRLTAESLQDLIPLSPALAAAKLRPPQSICGRSLAELKLRSNYGINVIAVFDEGDEQSEGALPTPETVIRENQTLLVIGGKENIVRLSSAG